MPERERSRHLAALRLLAEEPHQGGEPARDATIVDREAVEQQRVDLAESGVDQRDGREAPQIRGGGIQQAGGGGELRQRLIAERAQAHGSSRSSPRKCDSARSAAAWMAGPGSSASSFSASGTSPWSKMARALSSSCETALVVDHEAVGLLRRDAVPRAGVGAVRARDHLQQRVRGNDDGFWRHRDDGKWSHPRGCDQFALAPPFAEVVMRRRQDSVPVSMM